MLMRHGVGPYIGLNEIRSPRPMMNFITINCLFNFYFWIYPIVFFYLSISIFGFIRYDFWNYPLGFLFVLINNILCYCF